MASRPASRPALEGLGLGLVLGSCVLGLGLGLELKVLVNYCRGQNEARKFNQKIIHLFLHFLYNLRPKSVRHFFLSSHFLLSIVPAMFTLFPDCFDDLTSYRSALSHYTNQHHLAIGISLVRLRCHVSKPSISLFVKRSKSGDKDLSPRGQLTKYLQQERDVAKPIDAASFWMDGGVGKDKYPALHSLALKALSVPASSAPVERIFSRGGIILRPHRARLG